MVRVTLTELRRLMLGGDMLLPSVATCFLALERLQQLGRLGELECGQHDGQQQQQQQQAGSAGGAAAAAAGPAIQ